MNKSPLGLTETPPALIDKLRAAGHPLVSDTPMPGYARIFTADPFGNRIELLEPDPA